MISTDPRVAERRDRTMRELAYLTGNQGQLSEHEIFDPDDDEFIDPMDRFRDDSTGRFWLPLGLDAKPTATRINDEATLTRVRDASRKLVETNEFAINGTENRISYVVGTGHSYAVSFPEVIEDADQIKDDIKQRLLIAEVQAIIDDFAKRNKWNARQQEIVRRRDRDGEVFVRKFPIKDVGLSVRFVEPGLVSTPQKRLDNPEASFGIETVPDDVEDVLGYWVDGTFVEAQEIQHRKANVDLNVKRGTPTWWPVEANLRRAEKILRNMSTVAEVQTAIALIRKHGAGATQVEQYVKNLADKSGGRTLASGRTVYQRKLRPGSILDVSADTEYDFPAAGINASIYVAILQADLRAVASRLVMPEFMLTSDASNANFSSTLVAEGPAVKMFERLQWSMIEDDIELLEEEIAFAVAEGRLPDVALSATITATPPSVASRDRLKEVQADGILVDKRAMSRRTMSLRHELDPEAEKKQIEEEQEAADPFAQMRGAFLPNSGETDTLPGGNSDGRSETES